ncbi:MAG: DUF6775 family putative metallopeptidase, partial [Candidatus Nitrosopolaris sp.]
MLKFKNIHIYCNQANALNFNVIVPGLQKYFTNIPIDVRHPFLNNIDNVLAESLMSIRILDIKKPFNEQPRIKIQMRNSHTIDLKATLSARPSLLPFLTTQSAP